MSTTSTTPTASTLDPVDMFDTLLRELRAASTLLVLTRDGDERRRAALDGLQLAADIVDDARDAWLGRGPRCRCEHPALQLDGRCALCRRYGDEALGNG